MTDMNSLAGATDNAGQCGKNVGASFVSYPCRLVKGHPDDEPCVAPEVPVSIRAHDRWEQEQRADEKAQHPPTAMQSDVVLTSETVLDDAGLSSDPIVSRRITTYAEALEVADELRNALYRMRVSGGSSRVASELQAMLQEIIEAQNAVRWEQKMEQEQKGRKG